MCIIIDQGRETLPRQTCKQDTRPSLAAAWHPVFMASLKPTVAPSPLLYVFWSF